MKKFKRFESYITPFKLNYAINIRNYVSYSKFIVILITTLFFLGGLYYSVFHTPRYEATALLSTKIYGSLSATASVKQNALPLEQEKNVAPREIQILESYDFLSNVAKELNSFPYAGLKLGDKIQYLKDHLSFISPGIEENQFTDIIKVTMTDKDPIQIADIVNKIVNIAVENSKERERMDSSRSLALMRKQQENISRLISDKERSLALLTTNLDSLSITSDIADRYYSDALLDIDKSITKSKGEVALLNESLTDKSPRLITAKSVLNDYLYQKDTIMKKIKAGLKNADTLLNLKRDITVYSGLYDEVARNMEQFRAREQAPVGDLSVLQYALIPDRPVSYSIPVILFLSLLVGLISGYVVALASD